MYHPHLTQLARSAFVATCLALVALVLAPAVPTTGATRLAPRRAAAQAKPDVAVLPGVSGGPVKPDRNVQPLEARFVGDCDGGSFGAPLTQTSPPAPFSLALGDFNRDGDLDVAVPSYSGGGITPYFGDGAGGLAQQASVSVGGSLSADVMSGDLDRDGDMDLVAIVQDLSAVRVLLNDGTGAFTLQASVYAVGTDPIGGAIGDMNADGILDVVVANDTSGTISVLLGNGAGGLAAAMSSPGGASPYDPILGDFDQDGDLDVLVGTETGSDVRLLLNNGAGVLAAPLSFATGSQPIRLVSGDFNRDGLLDVATANVTGSASVLLANGPASFAAATTFAVPNSPISVDAADVNGDGALDLAVLSFDAAEMHLFPGDGAGTFSNGPVIATGGLGGDVKLADVDTDGRPDAITANFGSNSVSIQLNTCAACLPEFAPRTTLTAEFGPAFAEAGDFDRDGDLDLAVTNSGSSSLSIFFGDGAGGFAAAVPVALTLTEPVEVESADFDGDGDRDLAVGHDEPNTSVSILLNDGAGGFGAPVSVACQDAPATLVAADLDRDGDIDLAVANFESSSVSVLPGNGNGTFAAATNIPVGSNPSGILATDVDRDGDLDLATANRTSGTVSVLFNNGTGTFGARVDFPAVTGADGIVAEDFDRDGDVDLVVGSIGVATAAYLAGDGAGGFAAPVLFPFDLTLLLATADVNADGKLDILGGSFISARVAVVYGTGTGGFGAPVFLPTDTITFSATAADLDANGLVDIVAPNFLGATVSVILNNGVCPVTCVLTCPADVTQANDAGMCGAVVNYAAPTTTGDCGPITCTPASGSFFPTGTTTVTCTETPPVSCTFTVTVNDTENPTIACPANVVQANDAGMCSAAVNYTAPTAADNCGIQSTVCTPASGSTFPVGTTTVNCTTTDTSGNTASCSFTVTVNDTENPTIACPANVSQVNDAGMCSAVVNYAAPTASDNCAIQSTVCTPASGSTFPVGTTTVNCTTTDTSGNSASCSFTVTVADTQLPVITCPADQTVTATVVDGCSMSAVVNYPAPTTSDNCGVATVACVPASGTTFPEGTTTVTCTVTDVNGNQNSCQFTVTVTGAGAFGACAVDDVSGDTWSIVTDPASPVYRYWRYRVAATGEVFCGTATHLTYYPRRSLTAADKDDPRFFMNANLNYGSRAGTVVVVDRATGRQFSLRDRNLNNNPPCQ